MTAAHNASEVAWTAEVRQPLGDGEVCPSSLLHGLGGEVSCLLRCGCCLLSNQQIQHPRASCTTSCKRAMAAASCSLELRTNCFLRAPAQDRSSSS
eukprot:CAMPEP_0177769088 /NCGR_PEP_ID=MMETSP0491_2-20121128/10115_1 /TAXON_ID=63592 /ORGANISM="Tetraselmis chuii, Strain PLY429" /LENGTH=95 /DNA_ID=CAMNT_0019286033 /DNA_START=210 /DNA_END=497 /DNA_ORIENTATION=-